MNRTSLILTSALLLTPAAYAAATEHTITDADIKKNLAVLEAQERQAAASAPVTHAIDLAKVNSSTQQPPLNFTAVENSISRIEYELADLKVHLADMKEAVAAQAESEHNMRLRLKAELERKAIPPAEELEEESGEENGADEAFEDALEEELDEEPADIEIDNEQDAVRIIAKECEEPA